MPRTYEERAAEIGRRIREERKQLKLSPESFLDKIFLSSSSTKTLRAWETGERIPDLSSLTRMADLFACDIGYLLCDYDEKRRANADIVKETGLSGKAVAAIMALNEDPEDMNRKYCRKIDLLSDILSAEDTFDHLMHYVQGASTYKLFYELSKDNALIHSNKDYHTAENILREFGCISLDGEEAARWQAYEAGRMFELIVSELDLSLQEVK